MYFIGCVQIFIMTAISFERYYIIQNPLEKISKKNIINVIILCLFLSLFWSIAPLLGWSYYSYEDNLTSCAVEYKSRSINVISYNLAMFIFVFIIPIGIILVSNVKLLLIVSYQIYLIFIPIINNNLKVRNMASFSFSDRKQQKMFDVQRKVSIMMIIYMSIYSNLKFILI